MNKKVPYLLALVLFLTSNVAQVAAQPQSAVTATMWVEPIGSWNPEQGRWLYLKLSSETEVTQFYAKDSFKSSCGLTDLPGGFYSPTYVKEVTYRWWVYLPKEAPYGKCTINGTVLVWGEPDNVTPVSFDFTVVAPFVLYLPSVLR